MVWPMYGLRSRTRTHLDQGGRQEATQADVDDKAALDGFDDGALDNAIGFLDLLDIAPGTLVLGALLGQDQTAFLVLLVTTRASTGVADLDDLVRIDVLLMESSREGITPSVL